MDDARRAGLAFALILAACGGADDDGGDDDGGIEESTPILELTPRISRACSVVSPTTEIGDGLVSDFARVTLGGRHHALMTRNDRTIALAPLGLEPITLGAPVWSAPITGWSDGADAVARTGGGLVVAWPENENNSSPAVHRIAIAALDERGQQVGATRYVSRSVEVNGVELVARGDAYALAWNETAFDTQQRPSAWLAQLDVDGAPEGEPVKVADGWGSLAAYGDGYALSWRVTTSDATTNRVVLLEGDGARRTEPWTQPRPPGTSSYGPSLTVVDAGVLMTWTETFSPGIDDENGYTIVRFAWMLSDGTVGPIQRVQAPEIGMANVNPTWAQIDGALVLSWGRGDYIASCGGCMSDYRMHLVQLDPDDLAPISNVVDFGGPSGLWSAPIATLDGRDFAYLLAIDRHARFDFAAAMVRCEPLP